MVVGASTSGLSVDLNENLARQQSASYNFGKKLASRKFARWLLDMHYNHNGFLAKSENVHVGCTCASLKKPVRYIPVRFVLQK